jgi:hypothetical protein
MTEERKYAILFAATVLCARKLAQMESDRPSPVKICTVERAIDQAKFILDKIDARWATEQRGFTEKGTESTQVRRTENPTAAG